MEKQNNFEEKMRAAKLEYFREWRKNNKDKVKVHNRRFWEKKVALKLVKDKVLIDDDVNKQKSD